MSIAELAPSKNARFEQRYDRGIVERVKADLRLIIQHAAIGAVMPSYRALSRYLQSEYDVFVSGDTVKRLIKKLDREGTITEISNRATGA